MTHTLLNYRRDVKSEWGKVPLMRRMFDRQSRPPRFPQRGWIIVYASILVSALQGIALGAGWSCIQPISARQAPDLETNCIYGS